MIRSASQLGYLVLTRTSDAGLWRPHRLFLSLSRLSECVCCEELGGLGICTLGACENAPQTVLKTLDLRKMADFG